MAEVVSDWIKCVLQASEPWISTRHIERGSLWFSEINEKLRDVSIGIVCLTQENKNKPWILFESGALAKGLQSNRVCTFLVDLEPSDLTDPLAQFNHTQPNEQSVWELVRTLNIALAEKALDERVLEKIFKVYWPQFEADFKNAIDENPPHEVMPPRDPSDVLGEILENTRSLSRRISNLEDRDPGSRWQSKQVKKPFTLTEAIIDSAIELVFSGATDHALNEHLAKSNVPISMAADLTNKIRASYEKRLIEGALPDNTEG